MPLQGAIVVCYGGGKVTANFGGVDMVPLLGASVGCHCSVLWFGVEGDDLTQKLVFAIWVLCRSIFLYNNTPSSEIKSIQGTYLDEIITNSYVTITAFVGMGKASLSPVFLLLGDLSNWVLA